MKKIEILLECLGLASLILLVFLAAIFRFFGIDMSWSTDMAQLIFAWVCFIGADLAMQEDKHTGVDVLIDKFPLKIKNIIYLINNVLILGFLIFLVVYVINLCLMNINRMFNTIPISYSFVTASVPVGSLLMVRTIIKKLIVSIRNTLKSNYTHLEKISNEGGDIL